MFSLEEYRTLHDAAGLVDRSAQGRLTVSGADRRTYLQGLLTNDVEALRPGTGCYAAYLTPQGRMIADMQVYETGERLLVTLDGRVASDVCERWSRFIFSEDVHVADVSANTRELGVFGPKAPELVARALGAVERTEVATSLSAGELASTPIHGNRRWGDDEISFVLRPNDAGVEGFDIVIPVEREAELRSQIIESGAVQISAETMEVCRVEAGRPLFNVDMDTDTIPLEAGIEDRAISLTKGCYVGQEIIIRVMHRGHGRVARRLVGLTLDPSASVPARGDRLHSGDREIGTITSAVRSPALARPIALGYVHRDFVEPGTRVSLRRDAGEEPAAVTALPFVR